MSASESPSETHRIAAAVGVCGLALAAATAGRIGTVEQGLVGAGVSRLDLAGPTVIALAAYAGALDVLGRDRPVSWRRRLWRGALVAYPVWWISLALAFGASRPRGSTRDLIENALLFRSTGSTPMPSASVGWIVAAAAAAWALAPVWAWFADRVDRAGRFGPDPARRRVVAGAALVGTGLLVRAALALADRTAPFGTISWFPARLDLLGAGYLAATLGLARHSSWRTRARLVAAVTGAVLVAGAWVADLPRGGRPVTGTADVQVHGVLGLLAAVTVLAVLAAAPRLGTGRLLGAGLAAAAPGLVLWHEPALVLVARQYRERVVEFAGARFLTGTVLPLWCWGVAVAAALGLVLTAALVVPMLRLATGRWVRRPYPVAVAGLVGTAFLVRVVTLLTVAPERTDQGDPLFYHTTANLLANGRGFPEPLQWIAHGRLIPSALHGPLYPMVLSISSRIGGTGWVDHKFVSLLIGTAVVGLVGLLAHRLAGRTAALTTLALAAVYPNLWLIDGVMFPEGLLTLCTLACVLIAYSWRTRPRLGLAAALGGMIGLAALTRGEGIFLSFLLVIPWFWRRPGLDRRTRWRHLVVAGATCVAVLAPWTIHNLTRFEVFVPLSTNGNELFVYANCPDAYNGKYLGFWSFACEERLRDEREAQGLPREPPGDEAEKAVYWRDEGLTYARDHLGSLPTVLAARVGRQWEVFRPWQNTEFAPLEGRDRGAAQAGLLMYYGLVAAAIPGVVLLRRRMVPLLPLGAQFASVTLTALLAYGTTRFRAPVEPVLCLLAGVGLTPVWRSLAGRLRRPDPAPAVPLHDERAFVLGGSLRREGRIAWSWRGLTAIGTVLAAVALPLRGLYRTTGSNMEEGFMLVFPERRLKGDVPNVDFLHLYGPGSLDALAGWYRLVGTTLEAERTFGLFQHLGIILGIYVLARAWGRVVATGCAVLATILVLAPIGLQALAWNGAVALGLWSVIAALRARAPGVRRPAVWWVVSGVLGGLALTFRPDLVLALVAAHAWLLWRRGRATLARVAAGVVVGLTPLWVHLGRAGLRAPFEGMILDPVFRLRPGRELPRPPNPEHYDGTLQTIADRIPPWWGLPHLPGSVQLFVWFFLVIGLGAALVAAAVVVHRRAGAPARTGVLVAASLFSVGLMPQAMQRPDSAHFAWVTCVSFPLIPLAVIEVVRLVRPAWNRLARQGLAIGLVATMYLTVFPFFSYRPYVFHTRVTLGQVSGGFEVSRGDRRWYLGDTRPVLAARAVVADLDRLSEPGQRLFVGPTDLRQTVYSDVFFYYLFPELTPATYFIEMDPGLANAEDSRMTDDLLSADWLILTRYWSGWVEPNASVDFGPDTPNAAVEDHFCLIGSYEQDAVRLYRRTDPAAPDCALPSPGPYEGPYEPEYDYAVWVGVPIPPRATDGTYPPGSPAAGDPPR